MRTVYGFLEKSLKLFPNRPIYHMSPTSTMTYGEFGKEVDKFQHLLQSRGIKKGDKCVIIGNNSPKHGALIYAMLKNGVISVPTYLNQSIDDKLHIIKEIKPKIIFNTGHSICKTHLFDTTEINHEKIVIDDDYCQKVEQYVEPKDVATILYTSGTSGKPKGVILTHENITTNIESIDRIFNSGNLHVDEYDKCVSFLPANHCYGLTCEYLYMTSKGGSMKINTNPFDLQKDFLTYNPTILCAVPLLFQRIHKKIPIQKYTYLSFAGSRVCEFLKSRIFGKELKHATCGGAPIDKELLKYFHQLGVPIFQGYGTTEASPMITLNAGTRNKYGSVGRVLDCNKIMFSENGEIMVSGTNISQGYYKHDSQSFVEIDGNHWYKTGDLGHLEGEYLFIDGRESNTYKLANGKFVNPEEIEGMLCRIPEISQCMVFTPDGLINMAIVVSNESEYTIIQCVNKLKSRMKGYEFPTKFIVVKEPFDQKFLTQKQSLKRKLVLKEFEDKL